MAYNRTGAFLKQFLGDNCPNPPNVIIQTFAPTSSLYKNFNIGDIWLHYSGQAGVQPTVVGYMLMSVALQTAQWVPFVTTTENGVFTDFVSIVNNSASATAPADLDLIKTRNGGAIVAGDELGCINFVGTDTTPLQIIAASICAVNPATSTIAPNRVAGELQFSTHPDSASGVTPTLRMTLDEVGQLAINKADNDTFIASDPTFLNFGSAVLSANQENNGTGAWATLFKQRPGGPIQSGDTIGDLNFIGQDTGGTNVLAAKIRSVSSGTIAANRVAGDLEFFTHPDSASSIQQRMTISSAGNVTVFQADNDTLGTLTDATFAVVGASIVSQSNDNALAATGARAQLTRTRNNGPIVTGDRLGTLIFAGYGSDSLPGVGAQIASITVGTIDVNGRIPAGLSFFTHPDAAGPAITERMRIDHIGTVTIFAPTTAAPSLVAARSISAGGDPGAGVASATDLTNGTAVAGGGAGAIALQANAVNVAQAGWLKFYVNGVVSWVPFYQ